MYQNVEINPPKKENPNSLVVFKVIKLAEIRKVAPDAFKLFLSDVAITVRIKGFKYRLKNKAVVQQVLVHFKRIHKRNKKYA